MSSETDATDAILTLDPDTGAILVAWAQEMRYPPLKRESHHQARVVGFGTAIAQFAPPDCLLEEERLPAAPKWSLLPTSIPTMGRPTMHSVTHSVTSPNEAISSVPNASMLLAQPEGFSPTASAPMATYRFFPVNNEVSPEFQENHSPHRSQCILYSPSTDRSVSLSPTVSSSPLAASCSASSCRNPVPVEPSVILSDPKLQALVLQIFSEPWFLNGQAERNLTDKEAKDGLGSSTTGKSVFLAFASRLRNGSARAGKWKCLICETLPVTPSSGKGYTCTREDRILKHIRHHFRHRPWVCQGQCGMGECSMKFLSKESLDSHRRLDETARCDLCGILILRRNMSRHRGTWCRQRYIHQPLLENEIQHWRTQ